MIWRYSYWSRHFTCYFTTFFFFHSVVSELTWWPHLRRINLLMKRLFCKVPYFSSWIHVFFRCLLKNNVPMWRMCVSLKGILDYADWRFVDVPANAVLPEKWQRGSMKSLRPSELRNCRFAARSTVVLLQNTVVTVVRAGWYYDCWPPAGLVDLVTTENSRNFQYDK